MKFLTSSAVVVIGLTFVQSSLAVTDLQHCRDDVAKLCSEVKKGGGRITRCLVEHTAELSEKCKTSMGLGGSDVAGSEVAKPSKPEAAKEVELQVFDRSKGSHASKPQVRGDKTYADIRGVCLGELRSFCWDVKEGDTRGATDCLSKQRQNLAAECSKFLFGN